MRKRTINSYCNSSFYRHDFTTEEIHQWQYSFFPEHNVSECRIPKTGKSSIALDFTFPPKNSLLNPTMSIHFVAEISSQMHYTGCSSLSTKGDTSLIAVQDLSINHSSRTMHESPCHGQFHRLSMFLQNPMDNSWMRINGFILLRTP